ncbi:hypothetical protein C0992_004084 [Termitomyces sp. T32_za158]|nr:hypothetical protein C0992_004084 [Termitomyces sp. T32_za158]
MAVFVPNGLLGPSKPAPTLEPSKDSNQTPMPAQSAALETSGDFRVDSAIGTCLDSALDEPLSETGESTCTFFTNGLLSRPSRVATEDIDGNPSRSPIKADGSDLAFITNGLLSSSDDTTKKSPADSRLLSAAGILNFTATNLLLSTTKVTNGAADGPPSPTMPTFVTSGLLSSSSHRLEENPANVPLLSQDDDYLPTIHEAFGIPLTSASSASSNPATTSNGVNSNFSIRATTFDGKPIHFKRKPKVARVARSKLLSASAAERMGNLLDVPIHRLMEQLSANLAANLQERPVIPTSSSGPIEDTLWVDRYRPQRFTELMGNERVARETMTWVKRWDWCVFGNKKGKKRPRAGDENFDEMDEYHRPREKLLLISGPPGLGKTTLAHVIAKQAGYDVMEINASDARSGSIVDDRIRPTLESGSTVGSTKPVLLVIDEIDGATGAGDNFIKSRNQEVTEGVIRSATVGMKEGDTSISAVLNNIFSPLTKKRVKELGLTEEEESRYVARLSREIDGSGRENSIALGCFGHYATLRQHDANFDRYEKANEWLLTFDFLSSGMYTNGDFALSPYLSYTLVPFYPLFQERGGTRIERNQEDWENLQLTRSNEEVLKTLSRGLRSAGTRRRGDFRHLLATPVLQLEFVSFVNRIISPPLRPVNSQVIRPEEKALLTRLVDIMATLELRFLQERAEDGQLSYRLDPPIDVFVTYDGKRASDIAVSRYAVRRLVAQEIDAVIIARDADIVDKGKRGKHDLFGAKRFSSKHSAESGTRDDTQDDGDVVKPPNKRQRTDDDIDIADKPPTDFFGRIIKVPSSNNTKGREGKDSEPKTYRVTYRFTEGSSAAIRKPVKITAFL